MIGSLTMLSYIDPATTTALLSSLTSIGVAVGASFLIYWRKFKKGIVKVLHLDENSGKIVEDELEIYDKELASELAKEFSAQENTETVPKTAVVEASVSTKNEAADGNSVTEAAKPKSRKKATHKAENADEAKSERD